MLMPDVCRNAGYVEFCSCGWPGCNIAARQDSHRMELLLQLQLEAWLQRRGLQIKPQLKFVN